MTRGGALLSTLVAFWLVQPGPAYAGYYTYDPTYPEPVCRVHADGRPFVVTDTYRMVVGQELTAEVRAAVSGIEVQDPDEFRDPTYGLDQLVFGLEWSESPEFPQTLGGGDSLTYTPEHGGDYYVHWGVRDKGMHLVEGQWVHYETAEDVNHGDEWDYYGTVTVLVYEVEVSQENEEPGTRSAHIPDNHDDDDLNGVIDKNETGGADDEVKSVSITIIGPKDGSGVITIDPDEPGNPAAVRVYADASRTQRLQGTYSLIDDITLYVEGYKAGGYSTVSAEYGYGDVVASDDTTLHVDYLDISVSPFCGSGWGDPGGLPPGWVDDNSQAAEYADGSPFPVVGSIVPLNDFDLDENGEPDLTQTPPPGAPGFPVNGQCFLNAIISCTLIPEPGREIIVSAENGSKVRLWGSAGQYSPLPYTGQIAEHFWVEGVSASGSPGDVVLEVEQALPGPANYKVRDRCRLTVVEVDLDIDGRTDANEVTDPRPMATNDDDDNENRLCDLDPEEDLPVTGEDETVRVTAVVKPSGMQGLWRLTGWPNALEFRTTQSKAARLFVEGAPFYPDRAMPVEEEFWVECRSAGSHGTTLTYQPVYTTGPYSVSKFQTEAEKSDTVAIDGLDPEIDLVDPAFAVPDCDELTVGGFIPLNDNDDDGEPGVDHDCQGPIGRPDPDLIWAQVSFGGPCDLPLPRTLEVSCNSGKVRLWRDRQKQMPAQTPLNLDFDADMRFENGRYLADIYIEGIAASGSIRDTEVKVRYTRDGINFVDVLNLTVVDVAIDAPAYNDHKAVLISKTPGIGDDYPDPNLQMADRLIRIEAHTEPRLRDLPVYFSGFDPDDESPYETDPGPDNADGLGTIHAVPGYVYQGQPGPTLCVYSDPNGDIKVKLEITDYAAGDNYVVTAAAMKPPDATEDATGKMVAWKRVYYELDRMYRVGTDLTQDYVGADPYMLHVEDGSIFQSDDAIRVFDADHPSGETATVLVATPTTITIDRTLSNVYHAGYGAGGKGAAVAVPDNGFYEASTSRLGNAFGTDVLGHDGGCFVQFCSVPEGATQVPYRQFLGDTSNPTMGTYSAVWFSNKEKSNSIHIIGAEYCRSVDDGIFGMCMPLANVQCTYSAQIGAAFSPQEANAVAADSTAHETGHQFLLTSTDSGHPVNVWCHEGSGTDYCLMSYERDRADDYTEFCSDTPSHIYEVRTAADGL